MIVCVGISQYNIALLHTILHAFFKALLFLAAGQIIHSLYDQQDIVVILSNSGQSLIA